MRPYGRRIGFTATALLLPAVAGAQAGVPAPAIAAMMEEALVPGLQMAVISDGRITVLPHGVADARTGAPVTAATVFEAASLGKPVLAYAVLKLAGEGRIDLDARIGRYLDGAPAEAGALKPRGLLAHAAGLADAGPPTVERADPPRFSYSGEGYRLLQRLVERVGGAPLQDHMRRAVFEPLGMTGSSFVWRDDYAAHKASGHGPTGEWAGRNRITRA